MKMKDGIIVGGNCDQEHGYRRQREIGAQIYINYLLDLKIIIKKGDEFFIKRKRIKSNSGKRKTF